jgi:hypothetical protein
MRHKQMAVTAASTYVFGFRRRRLEATFLIEFQPSPMVLVEGIRDRSHRSGMLTSEDHRQLAERCIRLAKTCTRPTVAEQLMTLAANYLELAERALRLGQPVTAGRQQLNVVQKEQTTSGSSSNEVF